MSDDFTRDGLNIVNTSRELAVLIIVAVIIPHTIEFNVANAIDNSYLQVTVFAALWTASVASGFTIVGPYTSASVGFLTVRVLVFCILFLPLYPVLIIAQSQFMKGKTSRKSVLRIIGIVLIVQMFILFAFFWYSLDSWAFAQSYPLPIIHILIAFRGKNRGG